MRYFNEAGKYIHEDSCFKLPPRNCPEYQWAVSDMVSLQQMFKERREICGPSYIAILPFPDVRLLRDAHAARGRHHRNLCRILNSDEFARAFESAKPEQWKELRHLLQLEAIDALKRWIRNQLPKPALEELPFDALRAMAQERGIRRYSRLSKERLIAELQGNTESAVAGD